VNFCKDIITQLHSLSFIRLQFDDDKYVYISIDNNVGDGLQTDLFTNSFCTELLYIPVHYFDFGHKSIVVKMFNAWLPGTKKCSASMCNFLRTGNRVSGKLKEFGFLAVCKRLANRAMQN
jgi:hypothetical protein